MDATLDVLPGQGDTKFTFKRHERRCCDECGEDAHVRHTYLLRNCRSNPNSKAYGRDDCSWCVDAEAFACLACNEMVRRDHCPDEMEWATTFPASARFAHMFLVWKDADPPEPAIPASAICIFKDGDQMCAVFGDFVNLQESPAGFGDDFAAAIADLQKNYAAVAATVGT